MATMKYFNVSTPPTAGSPDGTYYVIQTENPDLIDTYVVSKGVVKRMMPAGVAIKDEVNKSFIPLYGDSSYMFTESRYVGISGQNVNSSGWRSTKFIEISKLSNIITFAGINTSPVPAIAYYSGQDHGTFISAEFANISKPSGLTSIYIFNKALTIPANAQYAIINCDYRLVNGTFVPGMENIMKNRGDIDNLQQVVGEKQTLQSIGVTITNSYINNLGVFTAYTGTWQRSGFIPKENLVGILKTIAGAAGSLVPAICYYKEQSESTFVGAEFGTTLITGNYHIYEKTPTFPAGAKYAAINCAIAYLPQAYFMHSPIMKAIIDMVGTSGVGESGTIGDPQSIVPWFTITGSYVNNLGVITSGSWTRTGFIPVGKVAGILRTAAGKSYTPVPMIAYFSEENSASFISAQFVSAAGILISGSIYSDDLETTIPENARFAIINCYPQYLPNVTMSFRLSLETLDARVTALENPNYTYEGSQRILTVRKVPGENEYGTLSAACAAAQSGDMIRVFEGIYEEISLNVKNGLTVVGVGEVIIKGELPVTASTADVTAKATIDCYANCRLENLIVTAQNCRYACHSDFGSGNTLQEIINCKFIHYGNHNIWQYRTDNNAPEPDNAAAIWRVCSAWGGGTHAGDKRIFRACYFESTARAFSNHNNANFNNTYGATTLQLYNCEMVSHGIDTDNSNLPYVLSLHTESLVSNTRDTVEFWNCKINGYLTFQNLLTQYVIGDSKGLKMIWTSGGSGGFANQIATLATNPANYPRINGEVNGFKNMTSVTIPRGYAVKRSGIGIALMTNADTADQFFGVALQSIENQKVGDVKYAGYLLRPYFEGIRTTAVTEGDDIGINTAGQFTRNSGLIVCKVVDNENIMVK